MNDLKIQWQALDQAYKQDPSGHDEDLFQQMLVVEMEIRKLDPTMDLDEMYAYLES